MKYLKSIFLITLLLSVGLSCRNNPEAEVKSVEIQEEQVVNFADRENYAAAQFTIKGMTCAMGCAKTIEKKLAKMDGMYNAKVDFENELATVEFDAEKIDKDALVSTVSSVSKSYSVEDIQLSDQAFSK